MAKNDLRPDILEFEIGAYRADSYKMEWSGDGLTLEAGYSHGYFGEDHLVRPDKEKWADFWQEMHSIKVWEWASEYSAAVLDGTSWSLKLKYQDRVIETHGHMAYPDPNDVSKKVEIDFSPPFRKLINSLNNLLGQDFIRQ